MKINKRGVSGIVTTVLLILVSITAVALIAAFIVPFITGNLDDSKACFDVLGKVEVVSGQFTCYDAETSEVKLMIKRNFAEKAQLGGLAVVLGKEGQSKRYDIAQEELPGEGEERTYTFGVGEDFSGEAVTTARLSPVLSSGKVCETTETTQIPACSE